MLRQRIFVTYAAIGALFVIIASCQKDRGSATLFGAVRAGEELISVVPWSVGDETLLCVVVQRDVTLTSRDTLPVRVLTIYRKREAALKKLFEDETGDAFLELHPLGEQDARLFTAWTGGSAYHFRVLAFVNGQVKQVLEAGARGMPEFTIDENERESILITDMELVNGQWTRGAAVATTDIYKWNGAAYDKVGPVPWAKRLQ